MVVGEKEQREHILDRGSGECGDSDRKELVHITKQRPGEYRRLEGE